MDEATAWTRFWRTGSACLPGAAALVSRIEEPTWRAALEGLPRGAAALDLATGDGAVPVILHRLRPDLRITGVDSASSLPPAPRGVRFQPGMQMEALRFSAQSFDLVTSRFGAEYGDIAQVAGEAARVLRPGGRLVWICHHRDSEIVRHNSSRREALNWAAAESGLLGRAAALTQAREISPLPTPSSFTEAVLDARRRYPNQSVAAEFSQAVCQVLEQSRWSLPGVAREALTELGQRAAAELARLNALNRAALDCPRADALADRLRDAGLVASPPRILAGDNSAPHAWTLAARSPE